MRKRLLIDIIHMAIGFEYDAGRVRNRCCKFGEELGAVCPSLIGGLCSLNLGYSCHLEHPRCLVLQESLTGGIKYLVNFPPISSIV